ncbi:GrpB family protein [Paenarthrobacter sp. Z7-10]|nr:GrpB family protein [Paenarthrobacter sp. Z7-10]
MPYRNDIINFHEPPVPEGQSPYVPGAGPSQHVEVVDWSEVWPERFELLAERVQGALGWRALVIEHVGSTAVRGLPAKPIIDIDLIVADPNEELAYIPALERMGFELRVREPWWFGHRVLRHLDPTCHLHVFGYDSPEVVKHRIFRDWLRANPSDRNLYAETKREAAALARDAGEHSMQYNARKEVVIREIYHRAFVANGASQGLGAILEGTPPAARVRGERLAWSLVGDVLSPLTEWD